MSHSPHPPSAASLRPLLPSRKRLYNDRDRLCELLGIPRGDVRRCLMGRMRQRINKICRQLGNPLNRNYFEWDELEMARLVQDVTAALNKDRANGTHVIPAEAVDAVINRLCLDNMRSAKKKSRMKRSSSKKPEDAADGDGDDDDEMTVVSAPSATKDPASANAHIVGVPAAFPSLPDVLRAKHTAQPAAEGLRAEHMARPAAEAVPAEHMARPAADALPNVGHETRRDEI
ncbi:hypothetical protein FN846DRAFT_903983 [Sphaerosporella brunnea]|uniref:Uncharacterized protein n=1 Tax=Sphaerosporella brunnea TaxID=1250544 RepID=A0A5J5F5P1_9PEZI|nr:hypothetical protein FN846DRAFT_903983 [Sphaerosporella brunnea]